MKIHVTRKHIKQGKRGYISFCPIALALKGYGFKEVMVDDEMAQVDGKESWLSKRTRLFIANFDLGKPVKPFVFNLKIKETP